MKAIDEKEQYFYLYAIKMTNRDGTPALGGDVVTDANADFVQQAGRSEQQVSMTMNAEGAKAWARLTKENIGKAVAIVLDDMVYSAPNVQVETQVDALRSPATSLRKKRRTWLTC